MTEKVMTMEVEGQGAKTLADWSVDAQSLARDLKHLAPDVVTVRMTVPDGTVDALLPIDQRVIIKKDVDRDTSTGALTGGTTWFVGRVTEAPVSVGANDESHVYTLLGPWYDLENISFRQSWLAWNGSALATHYTTHVLIPWMPAGGLNGTVLTINQQVQAAINLAINEGQQRILLGTIDLIRAVATDGFDAFTVTMNELRDITVAEVIKQMAKWCPDAVAWWDYTTEAAGVHKPTFHMKLWKRLPVTSLSLSGTTTIKTDITPRYDLQRPGVQIFFERPDQIDDETYRRYGEQKWPTSMTGFERGALVFTVELNGAKIVHTTAEVECETIDALSATPATRLAWWKDRIPWLKTGYIRNITVDLGTRTGLLTLPRWLKGGSMPEWVESSLGIQAEEQTIKAEIHYEKWDAETGGTKQADIGIGGTPPQVITFDLTATDAETGKYSDVAESVAGEDAPVNLARYIFDTLAILHFSGAVEDVRQECVGTITMGQRLNLNGGRTEWGTMNARIASIKERPHDGYTMIEFGPPENLSQMDLLDLLRINRRERWRWTSTKSAAGGKYGEGTSVTMPKRTSRQNATESPVVGGGGANGWG